MAYILIDGYNLIGIAHKNLESARNELIRNLHEYSKAKGHSITVVFDGWKDGQREESRLKSGDVTVIFSRLGDKADSVIKRALVSSATKQWIVVSSDREVADFAEKKDFVAVRSDEFERKLYSFKPAMNSDEPQMIVENEEYEDTASTRRKGNSRQLSKKDRKKIQALQKL
jgi:predicted RNA-binding protein with PIN domain